MTLRQKIHEVIFEADTPAGRLFDVVLLWAIALSVAVVCLDSVESYRTQYGDLIRIFEWVFTILFTAEYLLRLYSVTRPAKYALSFFGIVDLLSILPTFLSLFIVNSQYLLVIRILRLMRIFRVLKLARYLGEADTLSRALTASRHKITVFLGAVFGTVVIAGALMHLIEGAESGFTSIPKGIYWAVVTITTVGYGDISPITPLGQFLSSILMICGYGIIAVPTGIVSVELSRAQEHHHIDQRSCHACSREGHDNDAVFCKFCGERIERETS
ncbi:MAG: ion transporter [Bdellovibrionales bacterium]|nr:ion transporter [Bdellovibrionales bacterium]